MYWMLFNQLLVLTWICAVLMVDILMNAVVPLFFPDITISAFPELFAWIQWYYIVVCCALGLIVFYIHYWY